MDDSKKRAGEANLAVCEGQGDCDGDDGGLKKVTNGIQAAIAAAEKIGLECLAGRKTLQQTHIGMMAVVVMVVPGMV